MISFRNYLWRALIGCVIPIGLMGSEGCRPSAADMPETEIFHTEDTHETRQLDTPHPGENGIHLTPEQRQKSVIRTIQAGPGSLATPLTLTGEVKLNADRVAHVVPHIPGRVREVMKNLGDAVQKGEVMAVLDSRELADLEADYLASKERETLAAATFHREKGLWEKKISAELDFLQAQNALVEARINTRAAEHRLHAIGLTEEHVAKLSDLSHDTLTRYEITAPFDGVVVEKHLAIGEAAKDDSTAFIVADLSSVWVDFNAYQKDLAGIRTGQNTRIQDSSLSSKPVVGVISYIGPVIGTETRTAIVRAVLDNTAGQWRPGQFVMGSVDFGKAEVALMIPLAAVQRVAGKEIVFLEKGEDFIPTPVKTGRSDEANLEILEGIAPGQRIVSEGAFVLKATLERGELAHVH